MVEGSDGGARRWANVASPVATAKLNGVEPLAWLTDVLERMVPGPTSSSACCPGLGKSSGSSALLQTQFAKSRMDRNDTTPSRGAPEVTPRSSRDRSAL